MGKSPAFQTYASDFYMDTNSWTIEEIGIYQRLLLTEWVNGNLPNDEKRLARIAGCNIKKFQKSWRIISFKFILNGDGQLINKRLEEVRENQINYSESRRKNVLTRYQNKPTYEDSYVEHMNPSSSSSSKEKNKRIKHIAEPQKMALPDVKNFIDYYHNSFKEKFGTNPLIENGKDGKIVKELLSHFGIEHLKFLLKQFFESDDRFILESGYTIGVFRSQVNKLNLGKKVKRDKHSGLREWANEIVSEEEGPSQVQFDAVNAASSRNQEADTSVDREGAFARNREILIQQAKELGVKR